MKQMKIWITLSAATMAFGLLSGERSVVTNGPAPVVFGTPADDERGVMILGNGELGATAWLGADGVLHTVLQNSDSWNEGGRHVKTGAIDYETGRPVDAGTFRQELSMERGEFEATWKSGGRPVSLRYRIQQGTDSIAVCDVRGAPKAEAKVVNGRLYPGGAKEFGVGEYELGIRFCEGEFQKNVAGMKFTISADRLVPGGWCHVNRNETVAELMKVYDYYQATGDLGKKDLLSDRAFGGVTRKVVGKTASVQQQASAQQQDRSLFLSAITCLHPCKDEAEWRRRTEAVLEAQGWNLDDEEAKRAEHVAAWAKFWNRSRIVVTPASGVASKLRKDGAETVADECAAVTRAYAAQRYLTACAGRGRLPIRFNGSLFTISHKGDPDYRRWGSGYWWQNTRLPYYPMFAAGDLDMLQPLFKMYLGLLDFNAKRTRKYLGHGGAYFPECMQPWGDHFIGSYGPMCEWKDRADKLQAGGYHKYEWLGQLEISLMAIRYWQYTQDDAWFKEKALPAVREYVRYFDEHYGLDAKGRYHMHPAQAAETWWNCTNPMTEVSGLTRVADLLLALPDSALEPGDRELFARIRSRVPDLPLRRLDGGQGAGRPTDGTVVFAPGEKFDLHHNCETPELYCVFPFRLCSFEKPNAEIGRRTYRDGRFHKLYRGWSQDELNAAYLGMTDEAREHIADRALTHSKKIYRWPAYWGPNFDWCPDQDEGGIYQNTIQSMLLQFEGRRIFLVPAWPKDWNCEFKLHAPYNTTVEGRVENGEVKDLVVTPASRRADVSIMGNYGTGNVAAQGTGGLGFPRPDAYKTLREDFKAPPPGYGEVPFWWWSGGDRLDKERLLEQIEELHKAGIPGVQVNYAHHRREGWPTQDTVPRIFSDEWWDVFGFAARECAKRKMGISLSNYTLDFPERENLWKRIGICTPDMRATELSWVEGKVVKKKVPNTYDPLNPESGRRVVERFFNPFLEKVPKEARGALNYFFQDELVLTRGILWLWSDDLSDEFRKRKGYDIEPMLPALFTDFGPDTAKVRLDMNDVMSALACERYYKPIYDWHASRGLIYGCDQATRGRHPMNQYIDYMRVMKYFTAPGFDTPGRSADIIKNKVGSSIAHLNRRPRVWLEGYHSQGWQASTSTIFDSTCHNFLYGANLLNLHGLYYTTRGGWWEWAPPCYHFRMPYWAYMKTFLTYFERLSYILSQGAHVCDVAVVNPLEPCVYNRGRGMKSVGVAHDIVRRLVTEAQTDVDFIDADSLVAATVGRPPRGRREDGQQAYNSKGVTLNVADEAYRMVILPDMVAIRRSSLEKLAAFKRAGGVVMVLGEKPRFTDAPHGDKAKIDTLVAELTSGATGVSPVVFPARPSAEQLKSLADAVGTPDFRGPGESKAMHRRIGAYDVYFICDLKESGACTFRAEGTPELWNPWDGSQKTLADFRRNADGTTTVKIEGDGAPKLVVFAGEATRVSLPRNAVLRGSGVPAASSSSFTLDGEWDFTLKPTLDNKWGDFRLPVRERFIGAEIRRVKMEGAEKLGLPEKMTVGFGPQFMESEMRPASDVRHSATNLSCVLFSWREGMEGKPCFQDAHHGLNGTVGDDFFILGPYSMRLYDVVPPKGAKPGVWHYTTFAYAPCVCTVKPVAHGVAPKALTIDGKERKIGEELALSAGYHKLTVRYEDFGRAALVVMRTDVPSVPSKTPLSMRWFDDPAVLLFDPFGGAVKEGVYSATLPPACEEIEIRMRGTLLSAHVEGTEAKVVPVGSRVPRDRHEMGYRVRPRRTTAGVATLTLRVAHEPGFVGGAVFTEPMRLTCGKGKVTLGNWALLADGLECYSGGAVYEKAFTLTREQAGMKCTLDLGDVGVCCGVSVNGGDEKVICCPPWRVEIGDAVKEGTNALKVAVYNTLNNHYQTIPTRYRTTVENAPSGLLGPVRVLFSDKKHP